MKKPGGLAVMIGMGPSKKGGSVLGLPGKEESYDDDDTSDKGEETKMYGKQLLKAIESKDPKAVFAAIEAIVSCCGEDEVDIEDDDE